MPIKPTKVLCKRTEINGKNHWWDDEATPPVRHERDNRMLVAGTWYDVVHNDNDSWDEEKRSFTFTIIDNQGNPHLHFMYDEQDKANWPDFCHKYGPRDYSKWFYTPEELVLLEKGEFVLDEDIFIKPGNYHWVKTHHGVWIIALCRAHNSIKGRFNWQIIGSPYDKMDYDFAEIGPQVMSQEKQKEAEEKTKVMEELMDEVCVLVDAINKNDPEEEYPSVEYVMPFVNKAFDNYHEFSFKQLSDFFNSDEE